ncbi:MAG: FAD-binding oxidoreductase [Acidobacteria bacterium]|nr:FAD-binding oxidoreductase [Acidobacteriota bacterium]
MAERDWTRQATAIVGPGNWTAETELRARGWQDDLPKLLVYPDNREQICELMRLANAERLRVAPAGGLTKQRMGGNAQPIDLVVSLRRLNRITDYQAADLTVSVEAGVPFKELEGTLRTRGQMLPLDVPFAAEATVGGVLATNSSGPRRVAYGSARDMVLGAHFVTAEGKLAKSGGKVVKNVAGYDLTKLLIGSFGTLGILTDATFRAYPIPPASLTLGFGFSTIQSALEARNRILRSPFAPQALEVSDSATGTLLNERALASTPFTLLVRTAGPEAVIERARRELPSLASADGLETTFCLTGEEESELWDKVRELTPRFLSAQSEGAVVKVSALLTQMGPVIAAASRAASNHGLRSATLARAGTGIVYCYLWPSSENRGDTSGNRVAGACGLLLQETSHLGGRAIIEWATAEVKKKVNIWGPPGDDFTVMQRIKAAWDPQGILNPGRFYGGI